MKKSLLILMLFISLFPSLCHAQNAEPQIERAIIRLFPLEQIWSNTLLKLNLPDKKIVRLRPVFKTFWTHRQQMIEGATANDRIKTRQRIDALKYKLKQELSKHLESGQVLAVIPQPHAATRAQSPRQKP